MFGECALQFEQFLSQIHLIARKIFRVSVRVSRSACLCVCVCACVRPDPTKDKTTNQLQSDDHISEIESAKKIGRVQVGKSQQKSLQFTGYRLTHAVLAST